MTCAYILKRDWKKHGNDWKGKIHIYCGDMDNYYLNNAVYLAEEISKKLRHLTTMVKWIMVIELSIVGMAITTSQMRFPDYAIIGCLFQNGQKV